MIENFLAVIAVYSSARTATIALLHMIGPPFDSTQNLPIGRLLRRLWGSRRAHCHPLTFAHTLSDRTYVFPHFNADRSSRSQTLMHPLSGSGPRASE